jgi:hypothetical protein
MSSKFNPAAHDKHADDQKAKGKKAKNDEAEQLEDGLEDTFPASDPVSITQPTQLMSEDVKPARRPSKRH